MLSDNIKKQVAETIIRFLTPLAICGGIVSLVVLLAIEPGQLQRAIPPALIILFMVPAWLASRSGKPEKGILFVLLGLLVPIFFGVIFNGGIRAPVFIGIIPIVTIIFCLYGQARAIVFSVIIILSGCLFVFLESKHLLPDSPQPSTALILFVTSVWLIFSFIFVSVPINIMFAALRKNEQQNKEIKQSHKRIAAAKNRLKINEERYRLLTENVDDIIWSTDMDLNFTYLSPSISKILGYTVNEAMALSLKELFSPVSFNKVLSLYRSKIQQIDSNDRKAWKTGMFEAEQNCKDGRVILTNIRAKILAGADKNPVGILGITRDITQEKELQEMLIQNEKMLSVGGLAAGMAHEINNPLAGVIQNTQVINNRLSNPDIPANIKTAQSLGIKMETIQEFMEARNILSLVRSVEDSGLRMASIVENMLSFARKGNRSFSGHKPEDLVSRTLELAGTDFNAKKKYAFKSIIVEKEYEDNLPLIACEGSKVQQVLLNIFNNGAHAMFEKGKKDQTFQPRFVLRLSHQKESDMLRIEIEDNGTGMDDKIRKNIFQPFFTTKPVGEGTGLGMSVSYFIITENHHGTIDVFSEPEKGTTFVIQLPVKETAKRLQD